MNIISRKDARLRGLSRYFTGNPCKHGHIVERTTNSSSCIECSKKYVSNWKQTDAGKQSTQQTSRRHGTVYREDTSNAVTIKKHRDNYNNSEHGKATMKQYNDSKTFEQRKNARLKNRYGIDLIAYENMYEEQTGCCQICNTPHDTLHVDHDHSSGNVRALLCASCNKGLGMFKDNIEHLQKAIAYLSKHFEIVEE